MHTIACQLERYARCYTRCDEQYADVQGSPLYALMPMMQPSQPREYSQQVAATLHAGTWTAIPASSDTRLRLDVHIEHATACLLTVVATTATARGSGSKEITLETLRFPEIFQASFKVSPRPQSLGLRYVKNSDQYLFQVIFPTRFECRLCFDALQRFGLLSPLWPTMVQFDNGMSWADFQGRVGGGRLLDGRDATQPSVDAALVPQQAPDETRLSSEHAEGAPPAEEPSIASIVRSAEIIVLSSASDHHQTDLAAQRAQKSQERARRMILRAMPGEMAELQNSLQQTIISEEFSFIRAASYDL